MYDNAELNFFRRFLEKMRIQSHIVQNQDVPAETIDMGLRKYLGREQEYIDQLQQIPVDIEENTVFKLTDGYYCKYIFFVLPQTGMERSLVLGPYSTEKQEKEMILQQAERLGISPSDFRYLENFYQSIPLLPDETPLMMALTTLAETMWGTGNAYKIVDLKLDKSMRAIAPPPVYEQERNSVMQMRLMQQRYDFENELMDKVSKGLWHRAKLMLSVATSNPLEQRLADPLRNQKNYCIICNTLMRKAAEKGGVHPLHLDQLSSQYAQQIELIANLRAGQNLISDMIQNYCRLVRQHNLKDYSSLIRKVITYVDAEISSNLSLTKLAKLHNVSPEYLSSLFHKETGKTLTRFISEKRLELGASLLHTSSLQIQTIAEYCGFPDAGYFAKVFKKHYGVSPKAYRETKIQ